MYPIKDGKLVGVTYRPAKVIGGPITPRLIVIHDTAGRLEKGSSVAWFQSAECQTSAHFVIELDGTIVQMVPVNKKAAHAGESTWNGAKFCNAFSVGIEIVNPGRLDQAGKAWFGQCFRGEFCETDAHGKGLWLPYTPAQIEAVIRISKSIAAHYADVNEIVGHHDISPGRKVDPSPLFPWEHVRQAAFAGDDVVAPEAEVTKPAIKSVTIQGSAGGNIGGQVVVLDQTRKALGEARKAEGFDWWALVDGLMLNWSFWAGLFVLIGTVIAIMERYRRGDIAGIFKQAE